MEHSRFAAPAWANDPDAVRAMLDLGLERREDIIAKDGKTTGRQQRIEKYEIHDELAKRQRHLDELVKQGGAGSEAVDRWNNHANIEADLAHAQCEDIGGGQSHRARLRESIASGHVREQNTGGHVQGSGSHHAQAHGPAHAAGNNYVVARGGGARRTPAASTPRGIFQAASLPTASTIGRGAPARPGGHIRPPSPHSQGTIRIAGGQQHHVQRPSSASLAQALAAAPRPVLQGPTTAPRTAVASSTLPRSSPLASSSAARPAGPAGTEAAAPPRPTLTKPVAAPTATAATSAASATSNSTKSNSETSTAPPATRPASTAPTTAAARPTPGPGDPALFTAYQPDNFIQLTQLQHKALWHAADPTNAEAFLRSHPQAASYLREASRRLINEVTNIIKGMQHAEIDRYIAAHQERKWMVAAAVKARMLLEHGSDEEIDAYYTEHADHRAFYDTAVAAHKSDRSLPRLTTASTSEVMPRAAAATLSSPSVSSVKTVVPSPAQAQQQLTRPRSTADRVETQSITSDEATRTPTTTSVPAADAQPRTQGTANNAAPLPNGSISTASSRDSLRSAATDITIPPQQGFLNIMYYGNNHEFVGHEQIRIEAPVNASLTVQSIAAGFDPRNFVAAFRGSLDGNATQRHHGLEGIRRADDGIWQEQSDEEL